MANQLHALVRLTGATGAILDRVGNVLSVVRNGAGDYTLNLSVGLDVTGRETRASQIHAAIRGGVAVEETSDTAVRVRCVDAAGAAADPTECRISVYKTQFLAS